MHPPFYPVDHKVDPNILQPYDERPVKRRTTAEPLRFAVASHDWPPVPFAAPEHDFHAGITLPSGTVVEVRPQLWIVPPPQRKIRHIIGRWLIRMGQRLILENRLG
ncbi:hypothetical protein [Loktanella sp. S4079]|uniref:hypothetical protein n=1 Tax=Loktanella sp. S4079 TaxID=579483 RepID=UPI0005F9B575|nr:hypothetical protein [Loktanella sp. S4079]KJZ19238.1 hypothetical protein TW80_10610 [Loktanella sp. S4079]